MTPNEVLSNNLLIKVRMTFRSLMFQPRRGLQQTYQIRRTELKFCYRRGKRNLHFAISIQPCPIKVVPFRSTILFVQWQTQQALAAIQYDSRRTPVCTYQLVCLIGSLITIWCHCVFRCSTLIAWNISPYATWRIGSQRSYGNISESEINLFLGPAIQCISLILP